MQEQKGTVIPELERLNSELLALRLERDGLVQQLKDALAREQALKEEVNGLIYMFCYMSH